VSQASGEWRGADDAPNEKNVLELVSVYKERLQQEAVLRVKVGACVSF